MSVYVPADIIVLFVSNTRSTVSQVNISLNAVSTRDVSQRTVAGYLYILTLCTLALCLFSQNVGNRCFRVPVKCSM